MQDDTEKFAHLNNLRCVKDAKYYEGGDICTVIHDHPDDEMYLEFNIENPNDDSGVPVCYCNPDDFEIIKE